MAQPPAPRPPQRPPQPPAASGPDLLLRSAHDLRQPFQAMRLFLHLLEARLEDADALELAGKLDRSLQSAEGQINSLLDYAALTALEAAPGPSDIDLHPLLERLAAEFGSTAAQAGLRLRTVASSARALSDPALLQRLLRPLLANALANTPTGGVLIGVRRRPGRWRVEIRDSGGGVPATVAATLFEPFVRAGAGRDRQQGLGLGLAIVRRAAELLGHEVGFATTPGRGSCFWVEMPAAAEPVRRRPEAVPAPAAAPAPAVQRIAAVAEDDALQLAALCSMVREWGWEPVAARTGPKLLADLQRQGAPPQIIITDYRLQGGQNGTDLIAGIRGAFGAGIPALVLTGQSTVELDNAAAGGQIELVVKPFNPSRLRQKVEAMTEPDAGGTA